MTNEEATRFERVLGRLEEAVRALQEDRQHREEECARHWQITNDLSRDMTIEMGTRKGIAAAAQAARESIAVEAATARATIASEATARRTQRHWIIERLMPFVYPLAAAAVAYLFGKGLL